MTKLEREERDRNIINLGMEVRKITTKQIAEQTKCSESTVRRVLHKSKITRELVAKMYTISLKKSSTLTLLEISEIVGISLSTVERYLSECE